MRVLRRHLESSADNYGVFAVRACLSGLIDQRHSIVRSNSNARLKCIEKTTCIGLIHELGDLVRGQETYLGGFLSRARSS